MTTALLQLLDVSLGLILMQPVGNLEERIYNFFVLGPFLFAKRNGPFAKRNNLFAKGNGPNEKLPIFLQIQQLFQAKSKIQNLTSKNRSNKTFNSKGRNKEENKANTN